MNSLKKNGILMIFYEILGLLVPLILTPYLSRKLGAEGIGIYSYTFSITSYFIIFIQLGIKLYGKREIAKLNKNKYSLFFCEILVFQSILFIFIVFLYFYFIKSYQCSYLIKQALFIQGIELITGFLDISWFFYGIGKFKTIVISNIIIRILEIILIFLFIHSEVDILIYIFIMAGSNLMGIFVMWFNIKPLIKFQPVNRRGVLKHYSFMIKLFIPVLSIHLFSIIDKTIIGYLIDVEHVGFYESAYKIAKVPVIFITAIGNVMFTKSTKLLVEGESQESLAYIKISMTTIMFLTCAISFGLSSISEEFIKIYLGENFYKASSLLSILSFMIIFIGWGNVLRTQYILPRSYDWLYTKSVVFSAILNIFFSLILIKPFKTFGVAIASLISEAFICIYSSYKLRNELNIKIFIKENSIYFITGFFMLVFIKIFNLSFNLKNIILKLILDIFIGVIFYLGIICIWEIKHKPRFLLNELHKIYILFYKKRKEKEK